MGDALEICLGLNSARLLTDESLGKEIKNEF
jgi:hypothetical protein